MMIYRKLLSIAVFLIAINVWSQQDLKASYQTYTELPREVVYLHLNKTTLVKGEDLGFTAYVTDKATKNLYCVVTDKNDSIVKQQLLKVDQGITSGVIKIDSLFISGYYMVKAYTNYMRNFKERNHFLQQIRIIDPEKEKEIVPIKISKDVDIQLFPEGGHLIAGISNVMGVVVKDSLGFGVDNLEGKLKDSQNNIITTFKLNHLGIGRFLITPKVKESYHVEFNIENNKKIPIVNIEDEGVNMQLTNMGNKIGLTIQTNPETFKAIEGQVYTLAIHNGHQLEMLSVSFQNQKFTSIFNKIDLFSGVNIFTLFNQDNKPILERLYFNYEGIKIMQSATESKITQIKDTTQVKLSYKNINPIRFNNFSISVLPADTKSYGAHHNVLSQTYLQPYIKSYIEDAQYYFTNITKKKQYDLDNLLLTQGWSAYAWDDVFNNPPKQEYNFDKGISFKVYPEKQKNQQFLVAVKDSINTPKIYALTEKNKGFLVSNTYPNLSTPIEISKVRSSGKVLASENLRLEFYPNHTPNAFGNQSILKTKSLYSTQNIQITNFNQKTISNMQQLGEVLVEGQKKRTRIDDIKIKNPSRVEILDDNMKLRYFFFEEYIVSRGYYFKEDDAGRVQLVNRSAEKSFVPDMTLEQMEQEGLIGLNKKDPYPTVFIDGMEIQNIEFLKDYELRNVDYITINKHRHFYSSKVGGTIHVVTKSGVPNIPESIRKTASTYKFPFTFESKKEFYKPIYPTYTSRFFKEYGVVEWLPENSLNEKGELQIRFPSLEQEEVKLFVEGITKDGIFISEIKRIVLKE